MMMMPAVDNCSLVHKSSLAVLPAETSVASRKNGRRNENFAYQYLRYLKGSLTFHKIVRHGTYGFTSHPKEGVLRIYIPIKNPLPRWGFESATLGCSSTDTNHYTTEATIHEVTTKDRHLTPCNSIVLHKPLVS
jgi:hypothetical protein